MADMNKSIKCSKCGYILKENGKCQDAVLWYNAACPVLETA